MSPSLAVAACAAAAAATFAKPVQWPLWLLALLPLAGLMPWTGWLTVEELDLLVLAVCAGGYLRLAVAGSMAGWMAAPIAGSGWRGRQASDGAIAPSPSPSQSGDSLARLWLAVLPLALSTLISLQRGVDDAGGLAFGWWQGYSEPMNSVRLAKPLFEALLLVPLWRAACRADAAGAARALRRGVLAMLAVVAATVVWERLAFTGLLDFTSDYRATGLFWEMHVGGAALDAVLAMSLPFAVAALRGARTPARWATAAGVVAIGLYACLATFSRIVYAAVPLALLVGWWLQARQRAAASASVGTAGRRWQAAAGAAAFVLGAAIIFPGSGYRGLLALWGAAALLPPLADVLRRCRPHRALAAAAAVAACALVATCWVLHPKGAYLAYGGIAAAAALALALAWREPSPRRTALALGACAGMPAALAAVALHWGGERALSAALPVAAGLPLLLAAAIRRPTGAATRGARRASAAAAAAAVPQPSRNAAPALTPRWRPFAQTAALLAALSAAVGVFNGGAYMTDRLAQSAQDGDLRRAHWQHALSLLNGTADWAFGKGLGRYHAQYALSGVPTDQTGDDRLVARSDGGGHALVLASGRHLLGFGEIFRVSQRLPLGAGAAQKLQLRLDIRGGPQPVELHAEVCEKHLLYPGACRTGDVNVSPAAVGANASGSGSGARAMNTAGDTGAAAAAWRPLLLPLAGDDAFQGASLAPRLVVFSIGLASSGSRVEIDNLRLTDASGAELLRNGGFEDGMARWFFSSDRYHLPWHAKNQWLHLLFEQGWFGVAGFAVLAAAAAWRLLGPARAHVLSPMLAAGICGVLVVGAVDSLLDMPRVAWLLYLLLAVAVALPARRGMPQSP